MKQLIIILTIFICFNSCQTDNVKTIEGDLYFKLIDLRFFDAPDSILAGIENSVNTINMDSLPEQERKIYELAEFMVDNNILRKPFIRLKQDNGEIKMLILDSTDYVQIKFFNWSDLSKENKKVRIKANVTELKYDTSTVFKSVKILSVNKIDGKTYGTK